MTGNIFRKAYEIVTTKTGGEMTVEELKLVNRAMMPLMILKGASEVTVSERLLKLAEMVDGTSMKSRKEIEARLEEGKNKLAELKQHLTFEKLPLSVNHLKSTIEALEWVLGTLKWVLGGEK